MPLTYVTGDPLLTRAQALAFGYNARGRAEVGDLETMLMTRYPAAFSAYSKLSRNGRVTAGGFWVWSESIPKLVFMIVRDTAVGATRLRYAQSAALALARDYLLAGVGSLAIAPLGRESEWPEIRPVLETWFAPSRLPVVVYESYRPNVQAEEHFS